METLPNNIKVIYEPSAFSSDGICIKFFDLNKHNGAMVLPMATYNGDANIMYWDGYDKINTYRYIDYLEKYKIFNVGLLMVHGKTIDVNYLLNVLPRTN